MIQTVRRSSTGKPCLAAGAYARLRIKSMVIALFFIRHLVRRKVRSTAFMRSQPRDRMNAVLRTGGRFLRWLLWGI
jgi:hypothetical protein